MTHVRHARHSPEAKLSPNPPPLGPRLQGLDALIRNHHMEDMATRYGAEDVWPVNWKRFIENFMEAYHLSPCTRRPRTR